jgi:Tfp pilus assembly protein FimT
VQQYSQRDWSNFESRISDVESIILSLKNEVVHLMSVQRNSRGYSLVELVIVMACTAALVSAAVPNLSRLQQEWALWGGARLLESSMQWGRMHAISANASVKFDVDDTGRTFCWVDPTTGNKYGNTIRYLPWGVRIVSKPKKPVRFFQHGNAVPGGTYTIQREAESYSVVVSPGGRIRIQKN